MLGRPPAELRLVTLQLGAGCSAAAVAGGRSIDTTMGLTPLEGLVMATRSGDVDPSLATLLAEREGVSPAEAVPWLNERSGLLGLSGRSGDTRKLLAAEAAGDADAALALDLFCYRVRLALGAYLAALGGADAVVFGGGIGEHQPELRARICERLGPLGLTLDIERNAAAGGSIGTAGSPIAALVVPVDEERMLARDGAELLRGQGLPGEGGTQAGR